MRPFTFRSFPLLLGLATHLQLASAQDNSTASQLDPSATCPYQTGDQIQTCLARVREVEAQLPGGPCTSTDWECICNVQQGLIACYAPCPGTQPADDIRFNNENCAGQHNGVRNAAGGAGGAAYSGSPLTTTAAPGMSGTTGAPVSSATASSSASSSSSSSGGGASPTSTGTSSGSSSASGSSSSSSSSAAPSGSSSPASTDGAATLAFGTGTATLLAFGSIAITLVCGAGMVL